MPFEPLITAVIETTLNTLIKDDPELGRRLSRLKGQVIQIHLKEINKTLTFIFSQQIDVLGNFFERVTPLIRPTLNRHPRLSVTLLWYKNASAFYEVKSTPLIRHFSLVRCVTD